MSESGFVPIGDALQERIPAARKVVIPDAAHMVNMEQPEAFHRAVFDCLAGIAGDPERSVRWRA